MSSTDLLSDDLESRQRLICEASAGDRDAQRRLGDLYREGDELTPQDYGQARCWYRLAAEQGDANAANNLGAMYQHGKGMPANMNEAFRWYCRAAKRGLAIGQWNLAVCLLYGTGTNKDVAEAVEWLQKASRQGHMDAIAQLGTLYQLGEGGRAKHPLRCRATYDRRDAG